MQQPRYLKKPPVLLTRDLISTTSEEGPLLSEVASSASDSPLDSSYDSSDEEELILHAADEKQLMTKINHKIKQ